MGLPAAVYLAHLFLVVHALVLAVQAVLVCVTFLLSRPPGFQVSRSSMREMWNSIMSVVHGFVDPDLVVCRVTDPTHPVRFATPPGESCYTVVYAGKEPIRASRERRILGEYTGHVRAGNTNKQRYFAYLFVPISALV